MNNETEQPAEATSSSEPARPSLAARNETRDNLNDLTTQLHTLILIYISAAYYFDCYSLLFLLRLIGQNHITRGGIRIVLSAGILAIAVHSLFAIQRPDKREFWNHGGAIVDFVGERPASRVKLLFFDLLIIALQVLQLALHYKKTNVERTSTATQDTTAQDLDAEEAGISRANPSREIETEQGIEMQSLLPGSEARGTRGEPADEKQPNWISLRRSDFKEVFINTTRHTDHEDSARTLQRLVARIDAIRARRAAQATANTTST